MATTAFLTGAFIIPALLLWLGHRLRERSPRQRGAFWGGVAGHSIAMLVALLALHFPPVLWQDGARVTLAFWSMLTGALIGAAIGALRAR